MCRQWKKLAVTPAGIPWVLTVWLPLVSVHIGETARLLVLLSALMSHQDSIFTKLLPGVGPLPSATRRGSYWPTATIGPGPPGTSLAAPRLNWRSTRTILCGYGWGGGRGGEETPSHAPPT